MALIVACSILMGRPCINGKRCPRTSQQVRNWFPRSHPEAESVRTELRNCSRRQEVDPKKLSMRELHINNTVMAAMLVNLNIK
jgi:hypothetical protein